MTSEPHQVSPWGNKVVRAIGKANLWLAAIGFAALFLNVWGFYQMLSVEPSHLSPQDSKILQNSFYGELITSGIFLLAQAYTGWRLLRRGIREIAATMVMFCGLILYFLLVCSFGIWGSGIAKILVWSQPGIVLDWEMVTGYPAAAAVLLFCVRKNSEEAQQNNVRPLTSASGMIQVLRFVGWVNIFIASISLCTTFWKIWAYHQLQRSLVASPYGFTGIFRSALYLSLLAGVVLFLLQAFTGWRLLRQDIRIVTTCIVIFSLELLYFASFWGYAMYFRGEQISALLLRHYPAIIVDLQMVAGYPAAGIAVLYCYQRLRTDETGALLGEPGANQR